MIARCPHCGFEEVVPNEYAGETGICDKCGREFVVGASHISRENISRSAPFYPRAMVNANTKQEFRQPRQRVYSRGNGFRVFIVFIVICQTLAIGYLLLPNKVKLQINSFYKSAENLIISDAMRNERKEKEMKLEYERVLAWYNSQLEYNDLKEEYVFNNGKSGEEAQKQLWFFGGIHIRIGGGEIYYPSGRLAPGYAQELIEARMFISDYERSHRFKKTGVKRAHPWYPGL